MVSPSLNLRVSFCGAAACDISDNLIRREGDKMNRTLEQKQDIVSKAQENCTLTDSL